VLYRANYKAEFRAARVVWPRVMLESGV